MCGWKRKDDLALETPPSLSTSFRKYLLVSDVAHALSLECTCAAGVSACLRSASRGNSSRSLPARGRPTLMRAASTLARNPRANHWKQREDPERFLPPETFPPGTVYRSCRLASCTRNT